MLLDEGTLVSCSVLMSSLLNGLRVRLVTGN